MSHILRTAKKKSTRSAINTLVGRELRFGGYPSRRSRITTAPAGEIEQAGESCTRGGRTATVCMTTEDKEHKGKKNHAEADKKKTMKKRVQRRKRQPLGSVFVGQAPQNQSLADSA